MLIIARITVALTGGVNKYDNIRHIHTGKGFKEKLTEQVNMYLQNEALHNNGHKMNVNSKVYY